MTRRGVAVAAWAALGLGCAAGGRGRLAGAPEDDTARGWAALVDGQTEAARQAFTEALARKPSDATALFGVATLAYEQGAVEAALARSVELLESASRGEAVAGSLAAATLARLPRLLAEIPDRRAAERRLDALDPGQLDWRARYALALVLVDLARMRGDAELLARAAARAGCARAIDEVGTGGRLPLLDLAAETFVPAERARPLLPEGCRFELHTEDGRPGVRVLRSELELPAGRYHIVLDFGGAARLRIDRGPWHEHGASREIHGPRWSAVPVELGPGKHTVELRIGVHGAAAALALLAIPAGPAAVAPSLVRAPTAVAELALTLVANLTGETDLVLRLLDRLAARPRFALGLAVAGRLGEMDLTRPADVMRDQARVLWQRALAVDDRLARVWLDLSGLELQNERPREAAANAERARDAAPRWWPAHLGLATALRAQGFERQADEALAAGLTLVEAGEGGCAMIEKAFLRRQDRDDTQAAAHLARLLERCDAQRGAARSWARARGDLDGWLASLSRALPTTGEPRWLRSELADARLARGELAEAERILAHGVVLFPRDTREVIRLADVQAARGQRETARATLAEALRRFPARDELRQPARLAGLPLPLDEHRLDGAEVIAAFHASGRSYQAPAVVVLDRAVERVYPDGARLMLTHMITQVLSKDALEQVGEVRVPRGAEVLALRTRKADGTLREAEEIAGKPSISAPNLAVGDFVETETLEFKEPSAAFAPGFVGERFYFQSFDAPLDRSEYVFVAPAAARLGVDQRGGAPPAAERSGPDGTRVLTFVARSQPQRFAERSAVPALEWMPSVRLSSGVDLETWSRHVAERFARVPRGSPEIRALAAKLARQPRGGASLAEAIAGWVREHIEPEADLTEPATATLARRRGNRAGLLVALARALGVQADLVLARSRFVADADAPLEPAQLDDFREPLVRFTGPWGEHFVDPRVRRAPFGYLHAGLDGAKAIIVGTEQVVKARSAVAEARQVVLRARLGADGSARVQVTETLSGWPSIEWAEMLERAGKDRRKLRQGFEQHWLGQQFPGAELGDLVIEPGAAGTRVTYTFTTRQLADRQRSVLRLRPSFFRARPGRRFATEPERKTTLAMGHDIPLDLDAELVLPAGAKVLDLGGGGAANKGQARFLEERRLEGDTVKLRRRWRLPLARVSLADYPSVAAHLRAIDAMEQAEIRIAVPPDLK